MPSRLQIRIKHSAVVSLFVNHPQLNLLKFIALESKIDLFLFTKYCFNPVAASSASFLASSETAPSPDIPLQDNEWLLECRAEDSASLDSACLKLVSVFGKQNCSVFGVSSFASLALLSDLGVDVSSPEEIAVSSGDLTHSISVSQPDQNTQNLSSHGFVQDGFHAQRDAVSALSVGGNKNNLDFERTRTHNDKRNKRNIGYCRKWNANVRDHPSVNEDEISQSNGPAPCQYLHCCWKCKSPQHRGIDCPLKDNVRCCLKFNSCAIDYMTDTQGGCPNTCLQCPSIHVCMWCFETRHTIQQCHHVDPSLKKSIRALAFSGDGVGVEECERKAAQMVMEESKRPICKAWNDGNCVDKYCPLRHLCAACGKYMHTVMECVDAHRVSLAFGTSAFHVPARSIPEKSARSPSLPRKSGKKPRIVRESREKLTEHVNQFVNKFRRPTDRRHTRVSDESLNHHPVPKSTPVDADPEDSTFRYDAFVAAFERSLQVSENIDDCTPFKLVLAEQSAESDDALKSEGAPANIQVVEMAYAPQSMTDDEAKPSITVAAEVPEKQKVESADYQLPPKDLFCPVQTGSNVDRDLAEKAGSHVVKSVSEESDEIDSLRSQAPDSELNPTAEKKSLIDDIVDSSQTVQNIGDDIALGKPQDIPCPELSKNVAQVSSIDAVDEISAITEHPNDVSSVRTEFSYDDLEQAENQSMSDDEANQAIVDVEQTKEEPFPKCMETEKNNEYGPTKAPDQTQIAPSDSGLVLDESGDGHEDIQISQ